MVAKAIPADYSLGSHVAPLGMVFANAQGMTPVFRSVAFAPAMAVGTAVSLTVTRLLTSVRPARPTGRKKAARTSGANSATGAPEADS
jgi:glucose/arabinose dehydrogenase